MTFTLLRHTCYEAAMQAVNRNFWILSAAWKSRTTLSLLDQALQLSRTVLHVLVEPRLPWAAVPTCSSWPWTPGGTDALPAFLMCPKYIHHLFWRSGMEGHDWDGHYWDVTGLSKDWSEEAEKALEMLAHRRESKCSDLEGLGADLLCHFWLPAGDTS